MKNKFKKLFSIPEFGNANDNRTARLLLTILLTCAGGSFVILIISLIFNYDNGLSKGFSFANLVLCTSLYFFYKQKWLKLTSLLLLIGIQCNVIFLMIFADGIHDIAIVLSPTIFVVSGLLLDLRYYNIFASISIIAIVTIGLAETTGYFVSNLSHHTYFMEVLILGVFLIIAAVTIRLVVIALDKNLRATKVNEANLAETNKQLLEQKRQLELSETKYKNIFDNIQVVYFESDLKGVITEISPSIKTMSKYERDEIIGKRADIFFKNRNKLKDVLSLILHSGRISDFELDLIDKDGIHKKVALTGKVLTDTTGVPLKFVGNFNDISDKKDLEVQVSQMQKMDSLGTLAGGIAHDFNNLLTVINGHCEMAKIKIANDNPDVTKDIEAISMAGERAANLTQQILTFSRKQKADAKLLDINTIIRNHHKMMKRLIGEDISFSEVYADDLPPIKADPGQLEQVLLNLIVNARDAINMKTTKSSEKKISIQTRFVHLDEKYVETHLESLIGPHIEVSVSDNGIGMAPDEKNKIFEPFYTTKIKSKGTGLGLATVFGIVTQNKGTIRVYSELGVGTTFKVYWPIAAPSAKSDQEIRKQIPENLYGKESILLVEDEQAVIDFTSSALTSFGYNVYTALSGKEAVELIEKMDSGLDMLITDLVMPEIGGEELIDLVRSLFPDIKVLVISGYSDSHVFHNGLDKKLNFLNKPYSIQALTQKVRTILDS